MIIRFKHCSLPSYLRFALPAVVGLIMSAGVAEAQRPVPAKPDVPAAQQPAPTDCASAVRNRPANGRVLFGDESPKGKKGKSDKKKSSSTDDLVDLITRRISR